MSKCFRIHGDNIVECERVARLVLNETKPSFATVSLASPSTIVYDIRFEYGGSQREWHLELLPGFNKAKRQRWETDIFAVLKENGSFLDETPDVIVTVIENGLETILYALEFCSALQAGNQAWQRSGRAFSTGRAGCPYLYVVDFVKYELDADTRERKALRFPNPVVPYSYVSFSRMAGNFISQLYMRSEEFDSDQEDSLKGFDENNFSEVELSRYIVKRMCGLDTREEEATVIRKNFNVVLFLANAARPKIDWSQPQWKQLYEGCHEIISFSLKNSEFGFQKKISEKGQHGKSSKFLALVKKLSVGLASQDLPFGIIPAKNRRKFASGIRRLYPSYDVKVVEEIASGDVNLILCMIKGFKPKGDDNRPDRGILPLIAMLVSADAEILTYIYGPLIEGNLNELVANPRKLASTNGLWRSMLSLSDYIALDVPVIAQKQKRHSAKMLVNNSGLKESYVRQKNVKGGLTQNVFSSIPLSFHEDDVDTGIHFLFAHLLSDICFEGLCNPPGGDWSGLSICCEGHEVRWLSLPRVSGSVNGKRPDHVVQLFGVFGSPVLLVIESKEHFSDLEVSVGKGLQNYIRYLLNYVPNVERDLKASTKGWRKASRLIDYTAFKVLSAAAFLLEPTIDREAILNQSKCDLLFIMQPRKQGWDIEVVAATQDAETLKVFLLERMEKCRNTSISIV